MTFRNIYPVFLSEHGQIQVSELKSSVNLIYALEVLCMASYLYSHSAAGITYPRALVEILALGPRGVRFVPAVANASKKMNA